MSQQPHGFLVQGEAPGDYRVHEPPAPKDPEKSHKLAAVSLVLLAIIVVGAITYAMTRGSRVTGTYDGWLPLKGGHGYALITLTNSGSSSVRAKCTIEVSTPSGDTGYDELFNMLPTITVPAGGTVHERIPLTVTANAAADVTTGTVKNC
jgi:hypothetical protein